MIKPSKIMRLELVGLQHPEAKDLLLLMTVPRLLTRCSPNLSDVILQKRGEDGPAERNREFEGLAAGVMKTKHPLTVYLRQALLCHIPFVSPQQPKFSFIFSLFFFFFSPHPPLKSTQIRREILSYKGNF